MVFLFIFLLMILITITIRIKFEFTNIKFTSLKKQHLNKDYEIKITLYTFEKIPILKITDKKIKRLLKNTKIKEIIKNQETKILDDKNRIDKQILEAIRKLKIQLDEMNLKIDIGTENASLTALLVPAVSTILAIFLSKKIIKYNDKQIFEIKPIYINQNLLNIEFSGIFQIKMIHIINTICILNKKRKGDKNERTSNRRSYDYGYE